MAKREPRRGPRESLILAAILVVALGLRLWGIGFGLPHRYHIDEPYAVLGALRNASGDFSPRLPPNSPNLWELVLLVEYGALFVVGKLGNVYQSVWHFAESYRVDPTWFYLLARGSSALLGTATVAVVAKTAHDIYRDRRAGLLAALFLAVAFLPGRNAHYAVADTFVVFLTTLGVHLWARHAQGDSARTLLLGSFLVGIAVGLKWRPIGLVSGLLIAVLSHQERISTAPVAGWSTLKRLTLAGLALVAGFFVGFPALFISVDLFKWHLALVLPWASPIKVPSERSGGGSGWMWFPLPGWLFYLRTLVWGLGMPLLLIALGRAVYALRRRYPGELTVLASALGLYVTIGVSRFHFTRYALPLHPLLAILAAGLVSAAMSLLQRRWGAVGRVVSAAFIAGLIVIPAARLVRHDILLTQTDVRTLAKAWIEAHIPDGAKIAVDWPVHAPPLSTLGDPEPNSTKVYDVTVVEGVGLQAHPPQWYREQGIDYLIASSFIYQIPMKDKERDAERLAFYASLEQEFTQVHEFYPNKKQTEPSYVIDEIFGPLVSLWQRERPGPTLKVYRIGR